MRAKGSRPAPAPVAPLKATVDRVEAKVDRLERGITALVEATAALLRPHGPYPTVGRETPRRAPAEVVAFAPPADHPVPHGTADPAEEVVVSDDYAALAAELDELADGDSDADTPPPPPDERDTWRLRTQMWNGARMWQEDWGPQPGQEGCLVPQDLLRRGR